MYVQLQTLYNKYNKLGFVVLGFPCNQFGKQEPGSNEEIKEFVKQYGVVFPLFDKIQVNGPDSHPLFNYLKAKLVRAQGQSIKWNFTKFLCNRSGVVVNRYKPSMRPLEFEKDVVQILQ